MIISQVLGGLGNQMFQYAAGRALALRHNTPLLLDISGFRKYKLWPYELETVFELPINVAKEDDIRDLIGFQANKNFQRLLSKSALKRFRHRRYIVESSFSYWNGIEVIPNNVVLSGYWQSEKYFSSVADHIRKEFQFSQTTNLRNAEVASRIVSTNSVSLHLRRGDYANVKKTNETHGLCTLDYYRQAIRYIDSKVTDPKFYIFSDEPDWAIENLQIDHPCEYISHNIGLESYNDMRLMHLCKHNIIANSSFSWWGAWLNSNENKVIVAPKRWFKNDNDCKDLIPPRWITI